MNNMVTVLGTLQDGGYPQPGCELTCCSGIIEKERFVSCLNIIDSIKNGFFEREIGRRTEQYRYITHVFSTYDSRNSIREKDPFARGINSIQLMYDDNRWFIISILWNGETKENPLPQKYLRKKK